MLKSNPFLVISFYYKVNCNNTINLNFEPEVTRVFYGDFKRRRMSAL